jgi:hypothetical protein
MIDKKTFWIGVMTIVAAVLLAAHSMQPGPMMPTALAMSQEAVEHRDYAMATCETAAGGEVLYILDKRSGVIALIGWDTQTRRPTPIASDSLPAVFNR